MTPTRLDLKLLETLCNAFGPSGFEHEVQRIVRDYGSKYAEEVLHDRMGSLVFRRGKTGPKVMLAGHVDEIGFVITEIDKNGFLKFHQLGGWWDQTLLAQEVVIAPSEGKEKVIGIIGAPPPHVLSVEDRAKVMTKERMYFDIGCSSADEVKELGIRVGDPAVPYSFFRTMKRIKKEKDGDDKDAKETTREAHLAVSKAFDDRIGVFIGLEVLKRLSEDKVGHQNSVYFVSTTQEEVGLRGAQTAAQMIMPDIGFSLDVDISGDVPSAEGLVQKMGKGVSVSAGDGSMIPNPRLRKFVLKVAEEMKIKHQPAFLKAGGTDAGAIHVTGSGVPSLFIGIPTRHIHSHHAMLDLDDVENAVQLLVEVIKRLDEKTVKSFTEL
ncbi:MAG: M42 family metallopeptidase [Candidatus Thorarchaeota archaeon]|nr:M42 family metallopeptidase [Candidatus Thorarchaeota archaeon]